MSIILYFSFNKPGDFQLSEAKETTNSHLQARNTAIYTCQGAGLLAAVARQKYIGAWARESIKVSLDTGRVYKSFSQGENWTAIAHWE